MAIPVVYNLRSVKERWTSSVVAVLGIAGTVAVFVAMLALASGFQAAVVSSGLPENAIVQRGGSDSEMTSILNPWGFGSFQFARRMPEGAIVEMILRRMGNAAPVTRVGGRLVGRYWYNASYGGPGTP